MPHFININPNTQKYKNQYKITYPHFSNIKSHIIINANSDNYSKNPRKHK